MSSQYCLFYEKYALDFADQYLKWLQITYILFVNTENRMSLRVEGAAQWESCAASFFGIPANILLLGKSLNCLYLSQFLTDFHFLKKHLNASVLPQFWSTHLTSSFNFKFFKTGRANSHCAMPNRRLQRRLERYHLNYYYIMYVNTCIPTCGSRTPRLLPVPAWYRPMLSCQIV